MGYERNLENAREAKRAFLAALARAAECQSQVLLRCLRLNGSSRFGQEHGFDRIQSLDEYRKRVPVRSYAEFRPWIERAAQGESGVLSADDPVLFLTSSASTGAHKQLPVTIPFLRESFLPFSHAVIGNFFEFFPETALRDDATINFKWDPNLDLGASASGRPYVGASQIDYRKMLGEPVSEPGTSAPWAAPPKAITDHCDRLYYRVRLAAASDLRALVGINPAILQALPDLLEERSDELISEVRRGTVLGQPQLAPDPRRAEWLERCRLEFGRITPHQLWPRLAVLFCWTGAAAGVYLPGLRALYGPSVQIMPAPVAASEGPIGIPIDRHPSAGVLALPYVFLEFVDAAVEIRADTPTRSFDELQPGGAYQVIISHCAGLYRYDLGDIVRVVDYYRGVPRVEYIGRKRELDCAGEPLPEHELVATLKDALVNTGLSARNFRFHFQNEPVPALALALESREVLAPTDCERLAENLDAAFKRTHAAYARRRACAELGAPVLHLLKPGSFAGDWKSRVRAGSRPAQVKDKVFEPNEAAWGVLLGGAQ